MVTQMTDRYVSVNGLEMYYEVQGTGQPLILLHGGFGVVGMFEHLLPQLAATRQVIAVELQGHGHTADIDRPLSYSFMADDIAGLINSLGHGQADILGYSLGGGVALQTAIRHPGLVRKLVVISATFKSEGWYPEVLQGMRSINAEAAQSWVGSPMHQAYASVAPNPENWPVLADKTGELLRQPYDWSEDVAFLPMPVMVIAGDADGVRTSHAVEFFEYLGGGKQDAGWDGSGMPAARLAILPATTHYNILYSPVLADMVNQFLEAPLPEVK